MLGVIGRQLWVLLVFALSVSAGHTGRSSQSDNQPAFEVVSVKPNLSGGRASSISIPQRGQVAAINTTLEALLVRVYDLRRFELVGGPAWIREERFDILAKPPDGDGGDVVSMMKTLLADRFKLVARRTLRDQPVYALLVGRNDGKPGPRLTPSEHDCAAFLAAGGKAASQSAPRDRAGRSACTTLLRVGIGTMTVMFGGSPLSEVAKRLEPFVDRRIVDETPAGGNFDVELTFAWPPVASASTANAVSPEIFTAVREQLGLRLEPRNQAVDVLVVDSVDRPKPDY